MNKTVVVKSLLDIATRKFSTVFKQPHNPEYLELLRKDREFLDSMNDQIQSNAIFRKREFRSIDEFSVYRNLIYYIIRVIRPSCVVETGVLHGLTTSYILKGLSDNNHGELISIDLPRRDWESFFPSVEMGPGADAEFEIGREQSGWAIPEPLRSRWRLILGPSMHHLEDLLARNLIDFFIHDSDHSYRNMKAECELVLARAPRAFCVIDNYNDNSYFFERLSGSPNLDYMFVDDVDDSLGVRESTAVCRLRD